MDLAAANMAAMSSNPQSTKAISPGYAANMAGVAAVDRALSIVKTLEKARRPLTLTEIAEATELYPSTVLRLMASLEKSTLVVRHRDQRYGLGPLAFLVGKAYEATTRMERQLLPVMAELVRQGAESPSFHVRSDAGNRLCLLRLDSNHPTVDRVRAGDRLPIDRGAAGKVLLADGARIEDAHDDYARLRVSLGERDPSCAAIAGPVFGPGDELMGSLSLSGPMERFHEEALEAMKPLLLHACREATNALGGEWAR
jgi:DNA-binding IclR family transcriptional regulator